MSNVLQGADTRVATAGLVRKSGVEIAQPLHEIVVEKHEANTQGHDLRN